MKTKRSTTAHTLKDKSKQHLGAGAHLGSRSLTPWACITLSSDELLGVGHSWNSALVRLVSFYNISDGEDYREQAMCAVALYNTLYWGGCRVGAHIVAI